MQDHDVIKISRCDFFFSENNREWYEVGGICIYIVAIA